MFERTHRSKSSAAHWLPRHVASFTAYAFATITDLDIEVLFEPWINEIWLQYAQREVESPDGSQDDESVDRALRVEGVKQDGVSLSKFIGQLQQFKISNAKDNHTNTSILANIEAHIQQLAALVDRTKSSSSGLSSVDKQRLTARFHELGTKISMM